jgi:NAD(P)-dependent dehydrogenase (short-subunit alcohol dehydrogenase family)
MSKIEFNFSGKTVLVTGASRGIGYAVANGFVKSGANVTILAETTDVHKSATSLTADTGFEVHSIECDISNVNQVRNAIDQFDHIDVVVNNAGLERITPILDEDDSVEDTFRRIIEVNQIGTFYLTRYAARKMLPGASMIFTCSTWSRTAVAEFSAYCSSKHAVLGFMRSAAQELAPKGIRVNAVCPGWVRTDASMMSLKNMSERCNRSETDLLDDITGAQIIGGLMEPDDMASTYLFLASDAASNIVGQAIMVDRGEVLA